MSYNVLCDKYATRQQYGYCPSWALAWDYRKATIRKELLDLTPDIIALQVHVYMYIVLYTCNSNSETLKKTKQHNAPQLTQGSHFQRKMSCLGQYSNPWPSVF